jgi:hypothetical protein
MFGKKVWIASLASVLFIALPYPWVDQLMGCPVGSTSSLSLGCG